MSAIIEDEAATAGPVEQIKVLITLYPGIDVLELSSVLSILTAAQHNAKDDTTKAFSCVLAAAEEKTATAQGVVLNADIDFKNATKRLKEFDVLVIPGGNFAQVLKAKSEPLGIIKAFMKVQEADPARERTLLSTNTAALLLAEAGALQGMGATTHPDYYTKLEIACMEASARVSSERTDVMEERYVVNNARFDLGDLDENPFVVDKRPEVVSHKENRRRSSIARKGSNAWRESNTRRDSIGRRANLRLGGLRVITSGGVTSALDASLYLVCAMVNIEAAQEAARVLQYGWVKGVVVNAIDV